MDTLDNVGLKNGTAWLFFQCPGSINTPEVVASGAKLCNPKKIHWYHCEKECPARGQLKVNISGDISCDKCTTSSFFAEWVFSLI